MNYITVPLERPDLANVKEFEPPYPEPVCGYRWQLVSTCCNDSATYIFYTYELVTSKY